MTLEPPLPGTDDYVYVEEPPDPVTQIVPPDPEIARDAGVEGLVIVKVPVAKDGHVLDVWLDPKHEIAMLNEAAMRRRPRRRRARSPSENAPRYSTSLRKLSGRWSRSNPVRRGSSICAMTRSR